MKTWLALQRAAAEFVDELGRHGRELDPNDIADRVISTHGNSADAERFRLSLAKLIGQILYARNNTRKQ